MQKTRAITLPTVFTELFPFENPEYGPNKYGKMPYWVQLYLVILTMAPTDTQRGKALSE